jgi:large repetitive protein
MTSGSKNNVRVGHSWFGILLFAFVMLLLNAVSARADDCVKDLGGVIDGYVNPVPPSQIQIDGNCTIRNFPASNPLTSNISFYTQPGQNQQRWLIIFDNVVHTGNMACSDVLGHHIWFTNGSFSKIHEGCQNLFIPVEKIDKQNPAGKTTATIGVPFTYKLVIPVLFDPLSGTVINSSGSPNDLHGITVWDDLTATGVDLSFVSERAYWLNNGTAIPHTFSNLGGKLTFDNFPVVPAGQQFVIEVTVVLNDTPANVPGKQFINTAKWDFGRLIDGVHYEPLPGEWGVTPPLTIAAPVLSVTKSGPATMNLGQWGDFAINVQNTGTSDAWDVTLRDLLPHGATGGMCDRTPEILSAQVFAADGVTPIAGKGPLSQGSGYSFSYSAAPNCRLDITMLTAAARIGPSERLIVRYRTQLDADTQNGVALTNVAGAIQWFNGDSSNANRKPYTRTLTNGTPGILDHEDAHTVTVALTGYYFEKTTANLTSGANPATTAAPGDKLRYTLRFRTPGQALSNFSIFDEMDALNAQPAFVPGTLTLVTTPAGADISGTSSTGGAKGTGVIDIRNLNVPVNSQALIQFDITLASSLSNGTVVTNQSTLRLADGTVFALSDDPNVNGAANPAVPGDEDPTRVRIVSAARFLVQKISTDLTGDPNVLLAGETLRYTITVKNTTSSNAVNVTLRDTVPANTAYVAGSTKLNGAAVADVAGMAPLVNGMPINSPADTTPGSMPAGATATITFDVVVNRNVVNGTVISNQGFVTATTSGIADQPSDDPNTPEPNDPTRDIVGNLPLLYAEKRVALFGDLSSPGIVDPGDVLRYTITVWNSAAVAATVVILRDKVPANTTYIANSTLLNGQPVGQPDGGVSPLTSGIDAGTISAGAKAVLQFDLRVNPGTPTGTVISNQAVVDTVELPDLLTDGDGNPATGPEPTVVVVGNAQGLSITNQVTVVGGGAAVPGAQLEYVVRVLNIAAVPAINVVITDDLNASQPGQLTYMNGSATVNGATTGVTFAGSTITVDYGAVSGPLPPGEALVLRFRATLAAGIANGTIVTNTAVATWNQPTQTTSASVSFTVGSIPGTPGTSSFAVLNGSVWHDANFDDVRDPGERALAGWAVELYRDNQLSQSVQTDANGGYTINRVERNDQTAIRYELRFRAPGAGANTAMLGRAVSPFTNGMQRITDIVVRSGANLQGLNLPIHPNGVIYNSMARTPVVGATLTLLDARSASPLPAGCFDDAAQQGQITLADGYYKFDVNFSDPACPSGGDYLIGVTAPPGTTYVAGNSQIIPPTSNASTAAFSVPACPASAADAIPGSALFCEVQPSEFAPAASVPSRSAGTNYYVHLMLDGSQMPGSSQIFNNHIPLDPQLLGSIAISKTTPVVNVTRGQLVPYTITANNHSGMLLTDVSIVDRLPAGFSYIKGSALLDGVPTEPSVAGGALSWNGLVIAGNQVRTVKVLLAVGAGVTGGEYVNRAQALNVVTGNTMSGEATATVRLVPDPTFDCSDVTGKVFNDANRNGWQDDGEEGLPGVRVVTPRGLEATTDKYGRYHITCAITPNESRGSNFVLKLDDRTLPSGYRMSTDQVQIQRATSGKTLQVNFGASIHRVVSIDLLNAAFEPGTTEIRLQWRPRLNLLFEELRKAPAVLRLSYIADTEDAALVKRRVEAVKRQLTEAWGAANDSYVLTIEPEVFWRRGAPPKQPEVRLPGSR